MKVLLIGNGKVGSALADIIKTKHELTVYDLEAETAEDNGPYDVLHIVFPYFDGFIDTVKKYISKFKAELTLIESSVIPETTKKLYNSTGALICHSPARGLHTNLLWGLQTYTKFVGPTSMKAGLLAERYYQSLGMKTYLAAGSTETEVAKLANLSYFAAQIAYFQELERIRDKYDICYEDVLKFFESTTKDSNGEVQRPIFRGDRIGGTCVMQGLRKLFCESSELRRWIEQSNSLCPQKDIQCLSKLPPTK